MRLTKEIKNNVYVVGDNLIEGYLLYGQPINKLGRLEDIEDVLKKLTFYGKVLQYPNKIMELKFLRIYKGYDYDTDIRIEFELKNGLGNVFYMIWGYGKTWSLNKEDLQ